MPVVLVEGTRLDVPSTENDSRQYEVNLAAGDFFEVWVSEREIPVNLSVEGPDGGVLHALKLTLESFDVPELFVAPATGRYILTVQVFHRARRPHDVRVERTVYTLHVPAQHPATPTDRERARVFETIARADRLAWLQTMDGLKQALDVLGEAAGAARSSADARLEAVSLEGLAGLAGLFSRFRVEAATARERLTEVYARLDNRDAEIDNLHWLAEKYSEDGRLEQARRAVSGALDMARAARSATRIAVNERFLGVYEFELGNYDRARACAEAARDAAAALQDHLLESLAMWDLARLDDLVGDVDSALARNQHALVLASGDSQATELITLWLGFEYLGRSDLDEAVARFDAHVAMSRTFIARDHAALAQVGLGDVSRARGDRAAARQRYESAASVLQNGMQRFRCMAEQRVGDLDLVENRLDEARVHFETMLEVAARAFPMCEADARSGLAEIAARHGDLDTAEREARRAVELTEAYRGAVVNLESRAIGFGALAPAYERAIDIVMQRAQGGDSGATARALTVSEQALARGLLDRISEARIDRSARAPVSLIAEHKQLREQWRARLAELQVAARLQPGAPATKALVDETQTLAVRVHDLEARIDAADPRLGSFVRPPRLELSAIQALLDDGTLLLEYALGEARSYLWVVSSHDLHAFTLPPRATIERLARRVHEDFAQHSSTAGPRESRPRASEADGRALARAVLEPAASLLGNRRLVIVPSGALSLVPFGALPSMTAADEQLIGAHEIVQIPSATILAAMRMATSGRPRPEKMAAIFGDPIFDADDPRVRRPAIPSARGARSKKSASTAFALTRLPYSKDEAAAILSLVPAGSSASFIGTDATRERASGTALADYRFVHFATHAVVNQTVPSLSGIVLSMVDRAGNARDGQLLLPDVYDMTLNADVVVLSGCQTALGRDVRGEGPISLARAFMYAGAPRVVGSLWEVSDHATEELMKRFYRGMIVGGLTAAAALRAAQLELARNPRWADPFFWAPFVLQGDWR